MLVGVSDPLVMFFAIFVLVGVRIGIAAQPELLDELLALFVGGELLESRPLLVRDDVGDVLVEPLS